MGGATGALRLRVGACANRRRRQTGLWPNNAGANPELHARDKLFNLMPPSRKKRPVASVPVGNKGRGAALVPRLGEKNRQAAMYLKKTVTIDTRVWTKTDGTAIPERNPSLLPALFHNFTI